MPSDEVRAQEDEMTLEQFSQMLCRCWTNYGGTGSMAIQYEVPAHPTQAATIEANLRNQSGFQDWHVLGGYALAKLERVDSDTSYLTRMAAATEAGFQEDAQARRESAVATQSKMVD